MRRVTDAGTSTFSGRMVSICHLVPAASNRSALPPLVVTTVVTTVGRGRGRGQPVASAWIALETRLPLRVR